MRDNTSMPELLENRYRDFLSGHLDLIEPGLTLIDTELKLPNEMGAKGFVDIAARDPQGVVVLVELKRSDSAARSAIHELFKYATLFREKHGLDVHQFRCILLSTTWHELAVPYAEFEKVCPFEIEGKCLTIDSNGIPSGTEAIRPLKLSDAVSTSPKHGILLYTTDQGRERDETNLAEALEKLQISDYFYLKLDESSENPRVIHPFATYIALAELSDIQRSQIESTAISPDLTPTEEFEPDDESVMDAANWEPEEHVLSQVFRHCTPDSVEIGYPDKLRVMLETWDFIEVSRHGRFGSEVIWTDESILSTALSEGNEHTNYFTYQASTSNSATCERLLSKASYSLLGAGDWEEEVPVLIKHLLEDDDTSTVSVKIYSPCDIILGLAALNSARLDYLPALEIVADSKGGKSRIFSGFLMWDRKTVLSERQLMSSVLPHGIEYYRLAVNFGEQWQEESRLCAMHGLKYSLFELSEASSNTALRIHVNGNKLRFTEMKLSVIQRRLAPAFYAKNREYLRTLDYELHKNSIGSPIQATRESAFGQRNAN